MALLCGKFILPLAAPAVASFSINEPQEFA
jgi:hypothetical protein